MQESGLILAISAIFAAYAYHITLGSYDPEPLGGFGEDARPRTVLDSIFAWRSTWTPEPLSGFGTGAQPSVSSHTGHPKPDFLDLVSYIFEASGPVPGVLEINSRTGVTGAVRNYKPRNGKSIEFIYDPVQNIFAVGKPRETVGLESPHEALARVSGADRRAVLGGMFNRGSNGEILTNENSGHYGQRWNDQKRRQFIEFLEQTTGYPVKHQEWKGGE
jgi:hypothetical protein